MSNFPPNQELLRLLPIPIQLLFRSTSGILNQVPKQKALSTVASTLVDSLPPSMALVSA